MQVFVYPGHIELLSVLQIQSPGQMEANSEEIIRGIINPYSLLLAQWSLVCHVGACMHFRFSAEKY